MHIYRQVILLRFVTSIAIRRHEGRREFRAPSRENRETGVS